MKNEKANARHIGSNTDLAHGSTNKINSNGESISMYKDTTPRNKFQLDLFVTEQPKKVLQTINCFCCEQKRELDGYIFKLVPVCSDCRTTRSLEILSKQTERRAKR